MDDHRIEKLSTGWLKELSALPSKVHMALRWDDDVPARLGDILLGWHPGLTLMA